MISMEELQSPTIGVEISPEIKYWAIASAALLLGCLTGVIVQLLG